jgi:hypothetical protein
MWSWNLPRIYLPEAKEKTATHLRYRVILWCESASEQMAQAGKKMVRLRNPP